MKLWEFTNLVETRVHAAQASDWPDKPEASACPAGWLLIIDAENNIVTMAPDYIATMLVELFNSIEETNEWDDPEG